MPKLDNEHATTNELIYVYDLLHSLGQLTDDEHRELVADAKKNNNRLNKAC